MRKSIAILLAITVLFGILAGCKKGGGETTPTDQSGEKITITIGLPQNSNVLDYKHNTFTQWVEEQTGYNLEFQMFASSAGDYKSQIATMTAANQKLPDIMFHFNLGDAVHNQYGEDGYFLDLADYFADKEGKAKVWWDRFSQLDESFQNIVLRRCTNEDGTIYAFPSVETAVMDIAIFAPWINTKWLEAVGMEKPTNIDELYNVLVAFRDQDPNGNGLKDEIPLAAGGSICGELTTWIINMFCPLSERDWFSVKEDGTVYLPHMTDEYRQALIFMKKLVDEGLMPSSNMKASEIKPLVTPKDDTPQQIGIVVGHPTIVFAQDSEKIMDYEYVPMWGHCVRRENTSLRRTFITEDCENPDAAWEVLMCMCSEEGSLRMRYGTPGVDWDWPDEGTTSFMGYPAQYKLYHDVWETVGADNWRTIDATILLNSEQEGAQTHEGESEEIKWKHKMYLDMANEYDRQYEKLNTADKLTGPIFMTEAEEESSEQIRSDCTEYIKTSRSKFMTTADGFDPTDDASWQAYLDQLETLKVNDWIALAQEIYNRDNK